MQIVEQFSLGERLSGKDDAETFRLQRNGVDTGTVLEGTAIQKQFIVKDWSIVVSSDWDFDGRYLYFNLLDRNDRLLEYIMLAGWQAGWDMINLIIESPTQISFDFPNPNHGWRLSFRETPIFRFDVINFLSPYIFPDRYTGFRYLTLKRSRRQGDANYEW